MNLYYTTKDASRVICLSFIFEPEINGYKAKIDRALDLSTGNNINIKFDWHHGPDQNIAAKIALKDFMQNFEK